MCTCYESLFAWNSWPYCNQQPVKLIYLQSRKNKGYFCSYKLCNSFPGVSSKLEEFPGSQKEFQEFQGAYEHWPAKSPLKEFLILSTGVRDLEWLNKWLQNALYFLDGIKNFSNKIHNQNNEVWYNSQQKRDQMTYISIHSSNGSPFLRGINRHPDKHFCWLIYNIVSPKNLFSFSWIAMLSNLHYKWNKTIILGDIPSQDVNTRS